MCSPKMIQKIPAAVRIFVSVQVASTVTVAMANIIVGDTPFYSAIAISSVAFSSALPITSNWIGLTSVFACNYGISFKKCPIRPVFRARNRCTPPAARPRAAR